MCERAARYRLLIPEQCYEVIIWSDDNKLIGPTDVPYYTLGFNALRRHNCAKGELIAQPSIT